MLRSDEVQAPETTVSVYDAIYRRRMTKEHTDDPVADEVLRRLFDAAVWAPNHRLTQPTRFFALSKHSSVRQAVADLAWQVAHEKVVNPNPDQRRRAADASRDRVLYAPALTYAYSIPGDDDEITRENYATACCAVQNMALAAVAEGLCLDWSTGRSNPAPQPRRYSRRQGGLDDGRRPVHRQAKGASRLPPHAVLRGGLLALTALPTEPEYPAFPVPFSRSPSANVRGGFAPQV